MSPRRRGFMNLFRQKGLTSIVYGGIVVAIIFVFLIEFRPGQSGSGGSLRQECAAQVRGSCIEPREFFAELALIAPGRMFDAEQVRAMGLRRLVLEGMVERELLVHDAKRLGISVSEDELSDELIAGRMRVSLPADKAPMLAYSLRLADDLVRLLPVTDPETNQFDIKIYERMVRQFTGRSPTEFREMQRQELLAARMRDLIRSRARVGESEALDAYLREKSSASVDYISFHRDFFVENFLDTSPAAIDAWTKEHQEEVDRVAESRIAQYLPECRVARHILVRTAPEATDDEKAESRAKIEKAAERLKKGESFEKIARELSEDPGSAEQGGSLGCVAKGLMVKPFEDALFELQPGKTSEIVESQFGLHIIQLESILEGDAAEARAKRDTAEALMLAKEGEALAAETAKKVLAAAQGGQSLEDALKEALAELEKKAPTKGKAANVGDSDDDLRPRVESSGSFMGSADPIPGTASGQGVARKAFQLEKVGDLADDLIRLDDGYAIMQLTEKSEASREAFEEEREIFMSSLLAMKQAEALNSYIERLRDAAKSDIKVNASFLRALEADPDEAND